MKRISQINILQHPDGTFTAHGLEVSVSNGFDWHSAEGGSAPQTDLPAFQAFLHSRGFTLKQDDEGWLYYERITDDEALAAGEAGK